MFSVVIPLHNEAPGLVSLHAELRDTARQHGWELEIVLADDGSQDGTWQCVRELAARDPLLRGVRLRRQLGKAAALAAGIRLARGSVVFTMDGDGQDDPAQMIKLLRELEGGLDLVNARRLDRKDRWTRRAASWFFNRAVNAVTGLRLHDHNCGLKCVRREVFNEVRLYGELHRFIPVLAHEHGFRVGEVGVHHRPRQHGRSRYGHWRWLSGLLDLLMVAGLARFRGRHHHLLGALGLGAFAVGATALVYLAGTWVVSRWDPTDYLPVATRPLTSYAVASVLLGAQLLSVAYISAMLGAFNEAQEPPLPIADRVGVADGTAVQENNASRNNTGAG